jgi:hypothetical protein
MAVVKYTTKEMNKLGTQARKPENFTAICEQIV